MSAQIDQSRLAKITNLESGAHTPNGHYCVMEAVAYVAGEKWSDSPECVCPVLGAFMRAWNDGLPNDAERNRLLLPLIPRLVGTRGGKALEQRRATMAADWLIRTHTVAWLRLAKLNKQADMLASLPEITDFAQCPSLMPTLEAVRKDATAAWDAAWAAARDAAWAAARDAVWDAARAAAWDAARDAARAAAWDAAWDALKATTAELQQSALRLVERMIEPKD